ncbi:MAG: GDP-mannose 4,6-dehydratase [Chitinophagaceae bacterium]
MKKALIFGVSGQDGFYLSALLKSLGIEVIGISRQTTELSAVPLEYNSVFTLVKQHQPEYIFHFAANSTTKHEALFENHTIIATGTLNILEAVKQFSPHTKVFISGSGLQFRNNGTPIKETDPFEARDAYSISRIQSVYAARYFRSLGIRTYVGYFFNHDSPLRKENHMAQKIASAVSRIASGSNEKIEIGDLTVRKEWGFAGDIVKAVWTLVQQDAVAEAVIGTGKAYSIEDWLKECFSLVRKDWKDHVMSVEGYVPEYKQLVSDPSTIFSLGWKPEVDFSQLASMMVKP